MKMFNSVDTISLPAVKDNSVPSPTQAVDTKIRQILAIGEVCTYISLILCSLFVLFYATEVLIRSGRKRLPFV